MKTTKATLIQIKLGTYNDNNLNIIPNRDAKWCEIEYAGGYTIKYLNTNFGTKRKYPNWVYAHDDLNANNFKAGQTTPNIISLHDPFGYTKFGV